MQTAPQKARLTYALATLVAILLCLVFIYLLHAINTSFFLLLSAIVLLVSYAIFRISTAKYRRRDAVLQEEFPAHWRIILNEYVLYYSTLKKEDKHRFEQKIQIFLDEKRITGIQTEVDDTVRILVASSAIIPIFGFPEWEYDNLGEVLIYPSSFDKSFRQEGKGRFVTGMVGEGAMSGMMILSKPALIQGFVNAKDGRNVGIHEFVHLIDSADGLFDGIPSLYSRQYAIPWMHQMHEGIQAIKEAESNINVYGATNEVEFFAVASEYFFEHPEDMAKEHPKLYAMLRHIFNQHPLEQFKMAVKSMLGTKAKKLGRNSPCPCDSGKKYKRCCLKK